MSLWGTLGACYVSRRHGAETFIPLQQADLRLMELHQSLHRGV